MKILIIKLSSLGDIIHTLPLVHQLRQHYPEAQIDWLVGNKGLEILLLINELNNVYPLNLKSLQAIQKQNYDYVIDVQGLLKTAILARLTFGKKLIGFKNTREFADIFYDEKANVGNLFDTKTHIIDLNLKLISNLIKQERSQIPKIKFSIPKIYNPDNQKLLEIKSKKKKVLAFPSTTWESKLWPINYWYELLNIISKDFHVILCASQNDLH